MSNFVLDGQYRIISVNVEGQKSLGFYSLFYGGICTNDIKT
jgi:hypothetical protein